MEARATRALLRKKKAAQLTLIDEAVCERSVGVRVTHQHGYHRFGGRLSFDFTLGVGLES